MRNGIVLACALVGLSLLGLPLAGCDGGDGGEGGAGGDGGGGGAGGGTGGGPGVTVDEACASLAAALCAHIDGCSSFLMQVTYGDKATCESRVAARCPAPTELDGSNLAAADIAACAAAYEARTCAELYDAAPSECRVPGDRDAGATCASAAECKSNLCQAGAEGECGACGTQVAEGGSCAAADAVCETGLYCNGTTSKCDKPAGMGEACAPEKLCKAGLSCNGGTCGALLGDGADCSNGEVCDFAQGLLCFALDGTCKKLNVAKVGEACGYDMDTGELTTCEADARCDATDKCVARPKEGEACTVDADTGEGDCASGYDCIGGVCASGLPQCN